MHTRQSAALVGIRILPLGEDFARGNDGCGPRRGGRRGRRRGWRCGRVAAGGGFVLEELWRESDALEE